MISSLNPIQLYLIFALLCVIPVARIFQRAGFSPAFAVLIFVPEVGLILCSLILALKKWKTA